MREKRSQENGPRAEKDKTEIAAGLGRRTKEEIQKSGIKLTALRFRQGVDIRNPQPPIGAHTHIL